MIRLLLILWMLLMIFSGRSQAQCTTNCTPLKETFGSTATCSSPQSTTNAGIVNHINLPYNGGASDYPNDGQYSIRCDGAQLNWGWFGAGGTTMTDHTTDAIGQTGNYALINSGSGPVEYYHKTVTNLCVNTTYNLTYYAGNLVRDNIYTNMPSLSAYTFPPGSAVQPNFTFSGAGGTLLGSTGDISSETSVNGFKWNAYSYNFSTGAAQTSIDIVLASLFGNNAGFDFALDDITVTWVSGGGVSCTTPVELLSFTSKRIADDAAGLDWQTTEEINASHFIIERSSDGINFSAIGSIKAFGNTNQLQTYHFTDNQALSSDQVLYYRLQIIDLDGKSKYSKIARITSDKYFFNIYPSPLPYGEILVMNFTFPQGKDEVAVSIVNPLGVIVCSLKGKNKDPIKLNTEILPPGIYLIEIRNGNEKRVEKLIIQ